MVYLESGEAGLGPIPGSIQGEAVWGPRQLDLVRGNLVHNMEVGNKWSLWPFPTKIMLSFNDSMTEENNKMKKCGTNLKLDKCIYVSKVDYHKASKYSY